MTQSVAQYSHCYNDNKSWIGISERSAYLFP